jgi:hypothetical protein
MGFGVLRILNQDLAGRFRQLQQDVSIEAIDRQPVEIQDRGFPLNGRIPPEIPRSRILRILTIRIRTVEEDRGGLSRRALWAFRTFRAFDRTGRDPLTLPVQIDIGVFREDKVSRRNKPDATDNATDGFSFEIPRGEVTDGLGVREVWCKAKVWPLLHDVLAEDGLVQFNQQVIGNRRRNQIPSQHRAGNGVLLGTLKKEFISLDSHAASDFGIGRVGEDVLRADGDVEGWNGKPCDMTGGHAQPIPCMCRSRGKVNDTYRKVLEVIHGR